jgi:hypothetical protein
VSGLISTALRRAIRLGWRRGVVEGNRAWIVVGGLALVGHLAGRVLTRDEEVVVREKLNPGESFLVTHLPRS